MALKKNARKILFLIRFSKSTPHPITNVLCAITDMKPSDFLIGNLGMLISHIPHVIVGATVEDITKLKDVTRGGIFMWIAIIFGLTTRFTVVCLISWYTRKELKLLNLPIDKDTKSEIDMEPEPDMENSEALNRGSDSPKSDEII